MVIKGPYYPKWSVDRLNPYQNPNGVLYRNRKRTLKFNKRLQRSKALLSKDKARSVAFPNLKIHCKAIILKTVWHWPKDRHIDQWDLREPRSKSTDLWSTRLTFNESPKNRQWMKDSLFTKWGWGKWTSTSRRMNWILMSLHKEIKSKSITDLNTEPETIQQLEENIGRKILGIGLGKDFFGYDTKSTGIKTKNWQLGFHQTINLQPREGNNHQRDKVMYGVGENICNLYLSDKRLISQIDKDLKQFNSKKAQSPPKTKKQKTKQNKT